MKIKNLFGIILFIVIIIPFMTVNATNDVKYQLTITDDYKFNEIIKYEISDYRDIENGYNPFVDIIEDDVDVDILGKAKYKKTTKFSNGKYYITLSYTHSEYSMSNSIFLNDCFENSNYDYDMNNYSFRLRPAYITAYDRRILPYTDVVYYRIRVSYIIAYDRRISSYPSSAFFGSV